MSRSSSCTARCTSEAEGYSVALRLYSLGEWWQSETMLTRIDAARQRYAHCIGQVAMSAIAGIFSRTGAPIDPRILEHIGLGLAEMGPDGTRSAHSRDVGMLFRPFHTDAESRRMPQPLSTADGQMLCFEGHLHNASEIAAICGAANGRMSHVELVLAAYRRLTTDVFAALVGDFAMALWDPIEQRLLLSCDALGRRPLYYRATRDYIVWSSKARAQLAGLGLLAKVDDEYVADYLTNQPPQRSPFTGIEVVCGGRFVVASRTALTVQPYWNVEPRTHIRYRTDGDYERHFTALFREAVACRLAADAPVFCELSGGVDSSSIACVADDQVKRHAVSAPALHTVSHVYEKALGSDESPYIETIETALGRPGFHVHERDAPLLGPVDESIEPDHPSGELWFVARNNYVGRLMNGLGSRVLLSGIAGDSLFLSQPDIRLLLADLLVQARLKEFLAQSFAWANVVRGPIVPLMVGALRAALPRPVGALLNRGSDRWARVGQVADWFHPAFVRRFALRDRFWRLPDGLPSGLPTERSQCGSIRMTARLSALEPCASTGYVDRRYPYLDRRLVEFALAIPVDQKVRLGESRSIVRRGLRGIVPPAVLLRTTKSGPTDAFQRALVTEWPRLSRLLHEPRVASFGFVDGEMFRRTLDRARHGGCAHGWHLAKTLALELWLRTLEAPSRHVRCDHAARPAAQCIPKEGHDGELHNRSRAVSLA